MSDGLPKLNESRTNEESVVVNRNGEILCYTGGDLSLLEGQRIVRVRRTVTFTEIPDTGRKQCP